MYRSSFGTKNQIRFNAEEEYYEFLGFLAKNDGSTALVYEDNDLAGAWEKEGRILFYISQPPELKVELLHTAGVGRIISRVNCNEFVLNIIENHNFVLEELQD